MIVTILEIVAEIQKLPPDYAKHVHPSKGGTAEVSSFTDPIQETPYMVRIKLTGEETEGLRDVTCSCPATKLCKHIVAYYAVAKGMKPSITPPPTPPPEKGAKVNKGKKTNGKESITKRRTVLYDQISAAFAKLAELEDQK